jgi:hypothetical protein
VRELHDRRLAHRDLKAANILTSVTNGRPQLSLIDLVGVARYEKLPRQRCVKDVTRLHASFHDCPLLTRADRLRFLRVYLQWGLFGRGYWKGWWRALALATTAKIDRNARRGRILA